VEFTIIMRIRSVAKALFLLGSVVTFCAAQVSAGNTIFVSVDGLRCGGIDKAHQDAFTALTLSFGARQATPAPGKSTGVPEGDDVTVLKNFDQCTPKLLQLVASGTQVRQVVFEWQMNGVNPLVFMRIQLDQVLITAVNYSAAQEGVAFGWRK
jgi:type VI protein secretion system component Hcp